MFRIEPIDGWGFDETVDGQLADAFDVELIATRFEFAPRIVGWKAKALNGKYAGCYIKITPRNVDWNGVVVVEISRDETDETYLFSGMAATHGLECSWKPDLATYGRDGFLHLAGAVPTEVCETLASEISAHYAELSAGGVLPDQPGIAAGNLAIEAGAAGAPLIAALVDAGIPELVAQLAGQSLTARGISGNLNLPGSRVQDFHMDSARAEAFFIVNVMLVDCGPENGSVELVEGSHSAPLAYHQLHREPWLGRRRQITARQGDVLIRPSTLWHRGTTNPSATPRPMAALIYKPGSGEGLAPTDGPIRFYGNRYYGRFARAKEALAMHLPALDEALRRGISRLKGPQ